MADRAPSDESLRLELQEAIATFRHQIVQLVQVLGFSITANSILLGYGFSQRLAILLLAASLVPIATLLIFIQIMTGLLPITYVAIRLEWKLLLRQDAFIGTWVKERKDLPFYSLANLGDLKDPQTRDSMLNVPPWYFLGNLKSLALLASFVVQLGLVILSMTVYNFHFM
jgi:hypothetical protein